MEYGHLLPFQPTQLKDCIFNLSFMGVFLVTQMVKNLPAIQETRGSIPALGRSGEGNDNSLQYSCLENSMDRGTRRATVHGVAKSQT